MIYHNGAFVITTLLMFRMEHGMRIPMPPCTFIIKCINIINLRKPSLVKMFIGDNSTQKVVGKGKINMNLIMGATHAFLFHWYKKLKSSLDFLLNTCDF